MDETVLEDLLQGAWRGFSPYLVPLLLLATLCILRVRVAELLGEMYYVIRCRCARLSARRPTGEIPLSPEGRQRLEWLWEDLCNWRQALRDNPGRAADGLGRVNDANGQLVNGLEKSLPYLPGLLRPLAEELMRDCMRERQIWRDTLEKGEAFLSDAAEAYARLDRRLTVEFMPPLERTLRYGHPGETGFPAVSGVEVPAGLDLNEKN